MNIKSTNKSSCQKQPPLQNPYNVFYNNYMNTNATTECNKDFGYRMARITRRNGMPCREVFDFLPVPFPDSEDTKQQ